MRPAPPTTRQEATIDTHALHDCFEIEPLAPVGAEQDPLAAQVAEAGR